MTTFLIDLSPGDMKRRLGDALGIYVDAMRYPRGTEDQRASMWLEHIRRRGGADRARIAALTNDYFELTEVHVHPRAQGRGLGEALVRRLLAGRTEPRVLLSTPEVDEEANRAWRLYRRLGFTDVIRGYHFAGDPRPFAILGRNLPL